MLTYLLVSSLVSTANMEYCLDHKTILTTVISSGIDLSTDKELILYFYGSTNFEEFDRVALKSGFTVVPTASQPGRILVKTGKLTEDFLKYNLRLACELGAEHSLEYDGWEAGG